VSLFVDITGRRFGRFVVEGHDAVDASGAYLWWCVCDCGARVRVRGESLRRGVSRSCGCLRLELARETMRRTARKQHQQGTRNNSARLEVWQVRHIRQLAAAGRGLAEIAELHGIARNTAWYIVSRKRWGHVR
jgi:hypothetical protein